MIDRIPSLSRGLLFAEIKFPGSDQSYFVFTTHLDPTISLTDLRRKQVQAMKEIVSATAGEAPVFIAADLNFSLADRVHDGSEAEWASVCSCRTTSACFPISCVARDKSPP